MTTPQSATQQGQNLKAVGFMLIPVLFYSVVPVVIVGSGGAESPFFFNGAWRWGTSIGCFLILAVYRPSLMFNLKVWGELKSHVIHWMMLLITLNGLEYALFAWSTEHIEVPVASVLLELWPLGFIAILARWDRRELQEGQKQRYRGNIRSVLLFLSVAFAGVIFVVVSQTSGFALDPSEWIVGALSFDISEVFQGVGLALMAAVAVSFAAFTLLWARELSKKIQKLPLVASGSSQNGSEGVGSGEIELFSAVLGFAIGSLLAVPINFGWGFFRGESMTPDLLSVGIIAGFLLLPLGVFFLRKSLLVTDNLGVNALGYATPVITLGWLWLVSTLGVPFWLGILSQSSVPDWLATLSEIQVSRADYLIIGTSAIVAANLLINFEADRLLGFKALVISLWVCGTWVYLRDALSVGGWAAHSDGYFDVLFLSATVFALILSFRTVRLASRIQEEDNRAFKLFRELEELELRGVLSPGIYKRILTIDEKHGKELEDAYVTARRSINYDLLKATGPDRKKLIDAGIKLDALAHSRQQGINFGEICALFIFAGLVVGTALLSRPAEVSGLTGFLVEMFAMLFPAVILFLAFNMLDLQRGRVSQILVSNPQYSGYGVAFQDTENQDGTIRHTDRRFWEQLISVFVGLALIVAYAVLFLYKWGLLHQWGILADFPGRFPGLLS